MNKDPLKICLSALIQVILLLASITFSVHADAYNLLYASASIAAETPRVILQPGNAGSSIIYGNSTSAKVSVSPPTSPFYYPSDYNILTGTHISGSLPSSVRIVDNDYFIVRSTGSATSTTTYYPLGYNLLSSTTHVSGSINDLQSNDGAYMTFKSYLSNIKNDSKDFVDQTSNVDGNPDIGSHSNFTAMQAGPDGDYNILIEQKIVNEDTTSKTNALIAYRSNTGTNGLYSPKYRIWTGNSALWGSEIELPNAGSPVRWVRVEYCPVKSRGYEVIVMTISDDRYYDLYIWNGTVWLTFNNIGYFQDATFYRGFDVAYEHASGRALTVYSRGTSTDGQEIGYRIWDGKTLSDEYLLGSPYTNGEVYWINLASCPGIRPGTSDDNEIAMIYIDSNRCIYGYIWTGSSWNNMGQTAAWDNNAAIATEECIAVTYEQQSGRAMFIWGSANAVGRNYYRVWNGSTLSDPTLLTIRAQGGVTNWVTLKAQPNSNGLLFTVVDAGRDLNTAYWNGSAWTIHNEHDSNVDTHASRCADFAWSPDGSTGLLVWGTSPNSISYKTFTPPNTWSLTSTALAEGTHPWVQLRTNPHYVNGDKYVLGADLNSNNGIGIITWDGATFTIMEGAITANTGATTFECFEIAFMNFGPLTIAYQLDLEVQWVETNYAGTNKYLCIYAGSLNSENLRVDVWDGYSWVTVISVLAPNQWNNVSVFDYLTSSAFTIRFKATIEEEDLTQDSWQIDCVLLHTWNSEYTAEVEFYGDSNVWSWSQISWTVDICLTEASVNVTLQLFNYAIGQYSTGGEGYISYVSSDTPNTDETKTQTVVINPERFRDSDGGWRMKIKCVKDASDPFEFRVDLVKFEPTYYSEYMASTEFLFTGMTSDAPAQLNMTVVSQYNVTGVTVTVQVWNYVLGSYVTEGEGYLQYVSSGAGNETITLVITVDPEAYTLNGEAKIKITAVKDAISPFQQEINQIELCFHALKYDYVLQIANQVPDAWMIRLGAYDQSNINRLLICTVYFYANGEYSNQILIRSGEYSQQYGSWHNLSSLSTINIAIIISASSASISQINTYLEVLVPNTSTRNLMTITFEVS